MSGGQAALPSLSNGQDDGTVLAESSLNYAMMVLDPGATKTKTIL